VAVDIGRAATGADFHQISNALQRVLGEIELLAYEAEDRRLRRRDLDALVDPVVDAIEALRSMRHGVDGRVGASGVDFR
jgi:hypothetical protein